MLKVQIDKSDSNNAVDDDSTTPNRLLLQLHSRTLHVMCRSIKKHVN